MNEAHVGIKEATVCQENVSHTITPSLSPAWTIDTEWIHTPPCPKFLLPNFGKPVPVVASLFLLLLELLLPFYYMEPV